MNAAGVPCRSNDNLPDVPGAKRRRIALVWRPSHIRNLLVNSTYRGEHHFGKRSKSRNRAVITRSVPAIVSVETWEAAQQVLRSNRMTSCRTNRKLFLLQGLIKCGLCGLTFSGVRRKEPECHYYCCNGRHFAHALYGAQGKKCPAKS